MANAKQHPAPAATPGQARRRTGNRLDPAIMEAAKAEASENAADVIRRRGAAIVALVDPSLSAVREALGAVTPDGHPDHRARMIAVDRVLVLLDRAIASATPASGGGGQLVYVEELERRRAMWRSVPE